MSTLPYKPLTVYLTCPSCNAGILAFLHYDVRTGEFPTVVCMNCGTRIPVLISIPLEAVAKGTKRIYKVKGRKDGQK